MSHLQVAKAESILAAGPTIQIQNERAGMSDESTERNPKLDKYVSRIVAAYVATNHLSRSELPALIELVARSVMALATNRLSALPAKVGKPTEEEIKRSVTPDALISFIDGMAYKTLKRHLTARGLDPSSYRARYGLPVDYPMVAPSYSVRRTEISRGLQLRKSEQT